MKTKKSRNADYKLLEKTQDFEVITQEKLWKNHESTCGNITSVLKINPKTKKYESPGAIYNLVSAPFLLARLCALFKNLDISANGQEAYKTTWNTALKHKKTGHVITFYDWKGAASYGSNNEALDDKEFIKDATKLIKALCNDRCPHPYDGCVVGEVA
jgi:hypothetical protein